MRWLIGAILILIGIIYLGQNLNWWDGVDFENIGKFWPLLLVLFGVSMLTRHLKWGWVVFLMVLVASFGLVFYTTVYDKTLMGTSSEKFSQDISFEKSSDSNRGEIRIDTGALELNISEHDNNKFVEGNYTSDIYKPNIGNYNDKDNQIFKISGSEKLNVWHITKAANKADLKLSQSLPYSFFINAGASNLKMNLSKIICAGVDISAGASEINLTLGENTAADAKIKIKAGASNIKINLPKELGAKFTIDAPLSGKELQNLDKINDKEFRTKNYDSSSKKIEVAIDAGVSNIEVKQ